MLYIAECVISIRTSFIDPNPDGCNHAKISYPSARVPKIPWRGDTALSSMNAAISSLRKLHKCEASSNNVFLIALYNDCNTSDCSAVKGRLLNPSLYFCDRP